MYFLLRQRSVCPSRIQKNILFYKNINYSMHSCKEGRIFNHSCKEGRIFKCQLKIDHPMDRYGKGPV